MLYQVIRWEHKARLHGAQEGEGDGQHHVDGFRMKVVAAFKSSSKRLIAEAIIINQELEAKKEADKNM